MGEVFALSYLRYLIDPNHQNPAMTLAEFHFTVASFWEAVKSSSYSAALPTCPPSIATAAS